jgi:hypothetical protein
MLLSLLLVIGHCWMGAEKTKGTNNKRVVEKSMTKEEEEECV